MLPIHKFIAESLSQFLLDSLLHRFSIFSSGLKIVETLILRRIVIIFSIGCFYELG